MSKRRGSFHEDWNELLIRFSHRGTPAAVEDQLRDSGTVEKLHLRCKAFHLNQSLFEKSRGSSA